MPRLTTPLSILAVAGASIALAACGSSSGGDSANSAGASAGQGQGANQSAAFKKFQDCLKDSGVTLPDRGQRPGAGQGSGYGPPAGGDGTPPAGGAPRGGFADNPKFQAAMKACAKLRPQGLRGGPGAGRPQQNIKAFTPYLTCLKDQGLDIKVSDGFNALRNLKREDAKVQAALKTCQSKIPQRPAAPQGTSTTTTS
ncbi:MAG: hypothetical protein ABW167_10440 [Baekduia sp.]